MTQHFTRSTVSASFYCSKCNRFTQHRIDAGRKGPCMECIARIERERPALIPVVEAQQQQVLFDKSLFDKERYER